MSRNIVVIRLTLRCSASKATRTNNAFFSARQDPVSINNRMNRICDTIPDDLVNWDQRSCSPEKLHPTDGRGLESYCFVRIGN